MAYVALVLAAMVLMHTSTVAQESDTTSQDSLALAYTHVDVHSFELPLRLDSLISEPTGTSRDPQWTFVVQLMDSNRRLLAKSIPIRREWGASSTMRESFPQNIELKIRDRYRFFVVMIDASGNAPERIAGATPEFRPIDLLGPVPPSQVELPNMRAQPLITLNLTWN
jgi:hypothetical protein